MPPQLRKKEAQEREASAFLPTKFPGRNEGLRSQALQAEQHEYLPPDKALLNLVPESLTIYRHCNKKTGNLMKVDIDAAELGQFVDKSRRQYELDLKALVNIPSVSVNPDHKSDIVRTAAHAVKLLTDAGAKAQIVPTKGNPVVFAEMISSDSHPTVTVYNHLDVQPAEPSEWTSAPFDMKIAYDSYVGRGTTDDKGPALSVLYAARYVREHKIPINIKFIWELEEEIGSPSFETFLTENIAKLKTDSVVVSDTIWVSRERPAIGYGLRGLQGVCLKLSTGAKDVHSGTTGGLARNPVGELCQLISQCYDAGTGKVHIPGFYDDVRPLTDAERDNFLNSGFSTEHFQAAHELSGLRTEDNSEAVMRIWALPTFEVHGIVGGYTGPGIKTIVPHQAEAKISMRLVPDQDPAKILKLVTDFVQANNKDVTVTPQGTLHPYLSDFSGPYAIAARQSMSEAFGKDPAFVREGGSIGAVVSMKKILNSPIIFLGLSIPEHGYHAVNENFDWQQASGGIRMFVKYFSRLAQMKPN